MDESFESATIPNAIDSLFRFFWEKMHEYARIGFMALGPVATMDSPIYMANVGNKNFRDKMDNRKTSVDISPLPVNLNVVTLFSSSYLLGGVGARILVCANKNVVVVNKCIFVA